MARKRRPALRKVFATYRNAFAKAAASGKSIKDAEKVAKAAVEKDHGIVWEDLIKALPTIIQLIQALIAIFKK